MRVVRYGLIFVCGASGADVLDEQCVVGLGVQKGDIRRKWLYGGGDIEIAMDGKEGRG